MYAPKSSRINFSKDTYTSREEARQAAQENYDALEPKYQAGRSYKVVKEGRTSSRFIYEVYLESGRGGK